jgi:hypothetical protein
MAESSRVAAMSIQHIQQYYAERYTEKTPKEPTIAERFQHLSLCGVQGICD